MVIKKKIYFIIFSLSLFMLPQKAISENIKAQNTSINLIKNLKKEKIFGTNLYKVTLPETVGIINDKGKIIFEKNYDSIKSLDFEVEIVSEKGRKKLYSDSSHVLNKFFVVTLDNKVGVVDDKGKIISEPRYDEIQKVITLGNYYYFIVRLNNRLGLLDQDGKEILKPKYDGIETFGNSLFINKEGSNSFVTKDGRFINSGFHEYRIITDKLAFVKIKQKWGIINDKGNFLVKLIYNNLDNDSQNKLIIYQLNNKLGLIDFNGKIITAPIFDKVDYPFIFKKINYCDEFKENQDYIPVSIKNKWGFIDYKGNLLIKPKFDYVYNYYNGLGYVAVKNKNKSKKFKISLGTIYIYDHNFRLDEYKWGVIDKTGKWIVKPEFDFIKEFTEGFAYAIKDGRAGYINKSGDFVIKSQFYPNIDNKKNFRHCIIYFKDGYAEVEKNSNYQLIDKTGKVYFNYIYPQGWLRPIVEYAPGYHIPRKKDRELLKDFSDPAKVLFDEVSTFYKNLSVVNYDGYYGLVNNKGEYVLKPQYYSVPRVLEDRNYLKNRFTNKIEVINKEGKLITILNYDQVQEFKYNLLLVESKGSYGLLDNKFNEVLPPIYSAISNFSEGLAQVSLKNGNNGFIDKAGKFVVQPDFDSVDDFVGNGNATWVSKNDTNNLIDKKGNFISDYDFLESGYFSNNIATFKKAERYILVDSNNKLVRKDEYSEISKLFDNRLDIIIDDDAKSFAKIVIKAKKNHHYYLLDEKGKLLTNTEFQEITKDNFVKVNGLWGKIDEGLKYIIKPTFEDIDTNSDNFKVKLNNKWGIIGKNGHYVIEPKFDEISCSINDINLKVKLNNKWGIIDKNGHYVIEPKFDEMECSSKYINVKFNDKWGIIDGKGKFIVEPKFDEEIYFYNDSKISKVKINGKQGYINKKGKFILEPIYDEVEDINDRNDQRILEIKLNNKIGYVSITGKEIIKPIFDDIYTLSNGFSIISINNKKGILNKEFKIVLEPIYDDIITYGWEKDITNILLKNKYGFIDNKGKIIVQPKYDDIDIFNNGIAKIKLGNKWGLINKSGKEIIKPIYDEFEFNNDKVIKAKLRNKWGLIDNTGKTIVKFIYDGISDSNFSEGIIAVKKNNKWSFINKSEKQIFKSKFDDIDFFYEGLCAVKVGNKWGFINKSGELIIPYVYDKADTFNDGYARVTILTEQFIIDKKGKRPD